MLMQKQTIETFTQRPIADSDSYKKMEASYSNTLRLYCERRLNEASKALEQSLDLNPTTAALIQRWKWDVFNSEDARLVKEAQLYNSRHRREWKAALGARAW